MISVCVYLVSPFRSCPRLHPNHVLVTVEMGSGMLSKRLQKMIWGERRCRHVLICFVERLGPR